MRNKAMERKLKSGHMRDVSPYRTDQAPSGLMGYRLPEEWYQDNVDYCDKESEEYIRSIGRHKATGEIHASTSNVLYQHESYECIWLR